MSDWLQTVRTRVPEGGLSGVAPIHNLLDDHRLYLRWAMLVIGTLSVALLLGVGWIVWRAAHPPAPEYFASTADGRIIPLIPISEPYVPPEVLLTWVQNAVTQAYTLDHVHEKQQRAAMRELFTAAGFRAHLTALEEAGVLKTLREHRLITQVVATAPPIVTNQGVLGKRYTWRVEVPIEISYQGAGSVSQPQKNLVEVLVVRVPTHELARGYAIHQMVTRPAAGVR